MHPIKELLIQRNGLYCMLCGKRCRYNEIEWHHIKPKWVCKKEDGYIDNSYENGSLLCISCHHYVHEFSYYSEMYRIMMVAVRSHKKP